LKELRRDLGEMFRELVEYRELLYRMTARDLLVRYKQSVMGFGWAVFMPVVNTLIFTVIFTRVARLDTGVPYPIFAYSGLLFWNFFASSLRFSATSLSNNKVLVTKIYFPREIFPLSAITVCFVDMAVGLSILIGLMVYYQFPPTPALVFVPVVLLIQIAFTAGVALLLSMANVFLRDVKYIFEMILTFWMFASAVVYPVDRVGGWLGAFMKINPMAPIIDAYRTLILHGQLPAMAPLAAAAALAVVVLFVSWVVFHRTEYRFAEFA
jgi:ABC-type polysaccharide/polyol phosphate export permease